MRTARQTFRYQKSAGSEMLPGAFSVFLMVENDSITYRLRVSWSLPQSKRLNFSR